MTNNTKEKDSHKACLFSNTFRFIDDLCAMNNHLELNRNFKNICPPELQLKKENVSTSEASFLDLSIIIENNNFKIQLYDKRYAFPFSIVGMPHLDNYIPSNIYHASIASENLRFTRTTLDINTFVTL